MNVDYVFTMQWRAFTKQWLIYDAHMQCPMLSGDLGAHVVVCNARHIAVKDNSAYWKRFLYPVNTRFGVFRKDQTMEELHMHDPTEVLRREIRVHLPRSGSRRYWLQRLHLFPDGVETIPEDVKANLSGVITRVMPVPKRLDEYSSDELNEFPKLFDWPQDFHVAPLSPLSLPKQKTKK